MRHSVLFVTAIAAVLGSAPAAFADTGVFPPSAEPCSVDTVRPRPWAVTFSATPSGPAAGALRVASLDDQAPAARRPVPVEYSEAYKTRAKIHRIASFATLPLFVANVVVGQDLYNNPDQAESKRGLHAGLGATTGILFGANTVTGVWNLWEGRKDPNHKGRRMTHAILMMAADVGFLATGLMTPDNEGPYQDYIDRRSTHRAVAITSMGIATAGYLMMLFWR